MHLLTTESLDATIKAKIDYCIECEDHDAITRGRLIEGLMLWELSGFRSHNGVLIPTIRNLLMTVPIGTFEKPTEIV